MLLVIILYDQLLFRPIVAWADKFRFEQTRVRDRADFVGADLFRRARALRAVTRVMQNRSVGLGRDPRSFAEAPDVGHIVRDRPRASSMRSGCSSCWPEPPVQAGRSSNMSARRWAGPTFGPQQGWASLTLVRVVVLMVLATLIWVPIGVWIGLRPKVAEKIQPIGAISRGVPRQHSLPGRRRC